MKAIHLLLHLLPTIAFCQKQFAPLNTVWHYEGHSLDCDGYHIDYIVEKEIIIDNKDCSVIYAYTSTDLRPDPVRSTDSLIVWEDDSKVHFVEDTTFYLLFDFDMEVGDSINFYNPVNKPIFSHAMSQDPAATPEAYQAIVLEVEVVNVSDIPLRQYELEVTTLDYSGARTTYVEHVGSLSQNFTGDLAIYVDAGCFGGLQCHDNGELSYQSSFVADTPHPSCMIIDSNDELDATYDIRVFPNPVVDDITVDTEEQVEQLQVIDLNGAILRTSSSQNHITVEDLPPGIYLLRVQVKSGTRAVRFIKK